VGTYVNNAQIAAKLPYRNFTATSKPSTTDLDNWIDEAEAVLEGALDAAQITTPVTSTKGVKIVRTWVSEAVIGTVRMSFAHSGGDPNNESGQAQIEAFNERLTDIMNNPQRYQMLLSGGAGSDSSRQIRSHSLDHPDGKTISGGDFEPTFSTGTKF
jgi:hypothetical protein